MDDRVGGAAGAGDDDSRPSSGRPIASSTPARNPGASVLKPMSRPSSRPDDVVHRADRRGVGLDLVDEARDDALVRRGHAEAEPVRPARRARPRPRPRLGSSSSST